MGNDTVAIDTENLRKVGKDAAAYEAELDKQITKVESMLATMNKVAIAHPDIAAEAGTTKKSFIKGLNQILRGYQEQKRHVSKLATELTSVADKQDANDAKGSHDANNIPAAPTDQSAPTANADGGHTPGTTDDVAAT